MGKETNPCVRRIGSWCYVLSFSLFDLACERRHISGCRLSPPKITSANSSYEERFPWRQRLKTNHIWRGSTQRSCVELSQTRAKKLASRVFGFDSLNKHGEEALRFVFESKSDCFVNLQLELERLLYFKLCPLCILVWIQLVRRTLYSLFRRWLTWWR